MKYNMNICESYRNINININDDENIVPVTGLTLPGMIEEPA